MEHHPPSSYWEQPLLRQYDKEKDHNYRWAIRLPALQGAQSWRSRVSSKFPYQEPVVVITTFEFRNVAFHKRRLGSRARVKHRDLISIPIIILALFNIHRLRE